MHSESLKLAQQICRRLYLCYGVGAEYSEGEPPQGKDKLDALELVSKPPPIPTGADDKILLLTRKELLLPKGPLGEPPSGGFANPERGQAIVTSAGVPSPKNGDDNGGPWLVYADEVARRAVHQIGLLFGLHRCPDLRCAMSTPWISGVLPKLCDFCRERSEQPIHRARS